MENNLAILRMCVTAYLKAESVIGGILLTVMMGNIHPLGSLLLQKYFYYFL